MDLKLKGRKWIGSIYHKFEAMCHEVDGFVSKDTAKYIENQVQTVNDSVKKIYSDVLHDFHAPPVDSVQPKVQAVTEKQDGATGTSTRSLVDVDGTPSHSDEIQLPADQDTVNQNFTSSEVDSLRTHSRSPYTDFPEETESSSHWKGDTDTVFPKTTVIVEKDVGVDNFWEDSHISSSDSPLHSWEQHLLIANVESSATGKIPKQSDMSTSQDKRNPILDYSPENIIEDVGPRISQEEERPRISQEEETKCNWSDLSEKTEAWFSSDEIDDALVWNNSDWVPEEDVMGEHPACENVSSDDKNLHQFFWVNKQAPGAEYLFPPEDKIMPLSYLAEEDHISDNLVNQLPETVVPDERISCASIIGTMDGNADLYEEFKTNLSSEQGGMDLEITLSKEHQLVNSKMVPSFRSSSEFSLYLREQPQPNAESNLEKSESLPKVALVATNRNSVDKVLPEPSVSGESLWTLEDEEEGDSRRCFSEEVETDFSFMNDNSWVISELSLEKTNMLLQHAQKKYSGALEDLHLGIDGLDSLKYGSSSKSSMMSEAEEHTTNIASNLVPITAVQNTGLRPLNKNVANQNNSCDVLCTNGAPPDNFSQKVSLHPVVQAEESTYSLSTDANCNERTENISCDCTTPDYSAADLSTMSHLSLSGVASDVKIGKQIPSRTSSSADIEDDLAVDIVDTNLVSVDLSDKENLEGSVADDDLLCTTSFRPRKYKSYKELIKEAFASRKRLVKEYKQLPIRYLDFDNEINRLPKQHHSPQTVSTSTSESTLASPHNGELDWELL